MSIAIRQKSKNAVVYQVKPFGVTFASPTLAGSYILVIFEGQKSGFPYPYASLTAATLAPTISDDKSDVFTQVTQIINLSQEVGIVYSPPLAIPAVVPDAAGFFPSAFVFLTAATIGTTAITAAAFCPDEVTSPPLVGGRAVYDGGVQMQAYEITGMTTGVDQKGTVSGNSATIGASLITPGSANELVVEVLMLMDSSTLSAGTGATLQDVGAFLGGASFWAVDTTIQTSAVASAGFLNPLRYTGGVIAVSLK